MNDYKGLIETLNTLLSLNDENLSERVIANNDVQNALLQATDAIEQLAKERDAAVSDITELLRQPEVCTRCWACAKWEDDGKFVNCSQTSNDCTAECSEAEWRGERK